MLSVALHLPLYGSPQVASEGIYAVRASQKTQWDLVKRLLHCQYV